MMKHAISTSNLSKVLTIVGTRPQLIKSAPVSRALKQANIQEVLVHTGQHYDPNLSDVFFRELNLTPPQYHLGIGSGSYAYQVAEGLKQLEPILQTEQPDVVILYGDTNATLSGALAASGLRIPIAHIEAGLRSFNQTMPEERNRVLTDHVSTWCFAPTTQGIENLHQENILEGVHLVGDVMLDALLQFQERAEAVHPNFLSKLGVQPKQYILLTMHRAETTSTPAAALQMIQQLNAYAAQNDLTVLFPVHPRMRHHVLESSTTEQTDFSNIQIIEPLGYLEMLLVEAQAKVIVTDSGGVQKEAAMHHVPCITLREETEWTETIETGWNTLVGLSPEKLLTALTHHTISSQSIRPLYGNGEASQTLVAILQGTFQETLHGVTTNATSQPSSVMAGTIS